MKPKSEHEKDRSGHFSDHWVVTKSATQPSAEQIKAGQDHTGAPAVDSGSTRYSVGTGTEIEVTPEMIEAGLPHLYRYHPERGVDEEETIIRIFRAMLCVER